MPSMLNDIQSRVQSVKILLLLLQKCPSDLWNRQLTMVCVDWNNIKLFSDSEMFHCTLKLCMYVQYSTWCYHLHNWHYSIPDPLTESMCICYTNETDSGYDSSIAKSVLRFDTAVWAITATCVTVVLIRNACLQTRRHYVFKILWHCASDISGISVRV